MTALALALASLDLGVRIFLTNDEARFPMLAEAMLRGSSWLAPHLNGSVYLNKPALLAWLIAAASWPFGHVTQFSGVLPSALAGVATVLCIYRLGLELLGTDTALYAALVAASTQGLFLYQRLPMPDMLLVSLETASVWMLVRMWRRPAGAAWVGYYGFMAAAFWAKGPAGLLPLGVGLGFAALAGSRLDLRSLRLGRGVALFAIATAPWWVVGLTTDAPGLHRTLVVDQLWWYLPQRPTAFMFISPMQHLVGILFPWVVLLPWAVVAARRVQDHAAAERDAVRLLITWGVVATAIIAPSQQQRLRYYLPTLAPFALLIGWWIAGIRPPQRAGPRLGWAPYAAGAALAALIAVITAFGRPDRVWVAVPGSVLETGLLVITGGAMLGALVWGGMRRRLDQTWPIAFVAAATLVGLLYHGEVVRRNQGTDIPAAVPVLRSHLDNIGTLAVWELPNLPLAFYLGRPVAAVDGPSALRALGATNPSIGLLAGRAAWSRVAQLPGVHMIGEVPLGTERILLASVTPGPAVEESIATATNPAPPPAAPVRESAVPKAEIASILLALVGCALRWPGRGDEQFWRMRMGGVVIIAGLATFPRSWSVLALGVLVTLGWLALSKRRPWWPSTGTCVAVVLLLPVVLDAVEDLMDARAVSGDITWLATAAVGGGLLVTSAWRHRAMV